MKIRFIGLVIAVLTFYGTNESLRAAEAAPERKADSSAKAGAAASLGLSVRTNPPGTARSAAARKNAATNDPVEIEYQKVLDLDDVTQEEVDKWIRESEQFRAKGAADPGGSLKNRIQQRLDPVKKAYKEFIEKHPEHVGARLAFGSFLNDVGDEDGALAQWEKARELDPRNPAAWNNPAIIFGHHGPIEKAFEYFEKAIELKPDEPIYYQNLADHVYMFRTDATNHYHITEAEVFDKALGLYQKAMKLDPDNFVLATEYAQSFYGTKPPRLKEGLAAWEHALTLAHDKLEQEGVYIHLARIKMKMGRLEEARKHLDAVTDEHFATTKRTLYRNLSNAVPASADVPAK